MSLITADNIPLKNARYELYCQNRTLGLAGVDACAAAGFQRSSDLAKRLDERPEIIARMRQLLTLRKKQVDAERAQIDRRTEADELGIDQRWVLERLKHNVDMAQDAGQFGAAHSTLKTIAELIGMNNGAPDEGKDAANEGLGEGMLEDFSEALKNLPDFNAMPETNGGDFQLDPIDAEDEADLAATLAELDDEDPENIPFLADNEG